MVTQHPQEEVEFQLFLPDAREVFLLGDFNGWSPRSHPMVHTDDGSWSIRLKLPNGTHQFRYLADGEWHVDYAAFGLELCPFGYNSVVWVGAAAGSEVYIG